MSLDFLYFGLYTLFLIIIAAFFIIIRIHALKFKNFQTQIPIVLKTLCFILIILAIIGYISLYFIIYGGNNNSIEEIERSNNSTDIEDTINELQEKIY